VIDEDALLDALNSGQVGGALWMFSSKNRRRDGFSRTPERYRYSAHRRTDRGSPGRASADIATEVLAALKGEVLRWRIV